VKSLEETKSMLNEKLDAEMAAMAKEEAHQLKKTRPFAGRTETGAFTQRPQ